MKSSSKFIANLIVLISFLVTAMAATGCERESEPPATQGVELDLAAGELVFEDDFEREELGEKWETGFEGWELSEGALTVQGARNDALWLQEPLPEQFRVSFTARSDSDDGDIKFEILGDGATHESGYVGIFGGWQNRLNIIARLDEHGDDRLVGADGYSVEPGRIYQMDVARVDDSLLWYVDGELFLAYEDENPLRGDDHRYFGFNNWETELTFDEFRIYDLTGM